MMWELCQRVHVCELNRRIDATYYRSDFIENAERIRASGLRTRPFGDLITNGRRAVYFSTETLEADVAPAGWMPFLTSDDFAPDGFFVDFNTRRSVSPGFAARYPHGLLRDNELLVKVKGPNQITAYCKLGPAKPLLISGTIWGGLVKIDKIDPHYLVAALSSDYAVLARTRLRTNLNVEFLSSTDLMQLELPVPDSDGLQKIIGDKVRQAEALKNYSHDREARFLGEISEKYASLNEPLSGDRKHGRASPDELNGALNPGAFDPDRLKVRDYIKSRGGQRIRDFATVETPVATEYRKADWYIGLNSIGSTLGRISPSTIGAESVTGSVRVLSEGPVISKLRPYLNKVTYIPSHLADSFGSTELLCVRAENPALNWYLCGVLQLASTVRQLNPVSTGSTHPRVTRHDILDCYVPWIDCAEKAGLLLDEAQKAYFLCDKLIAAAKLLIEALIDRDITVDELATAQTQLESGDKTGDRAILSRLYEGGMDATHTRPLFPDLDAYYETLQMAEQALADGGDE